MSDNNEEIRVQSTYNASRVLLVTIGIFTGIFIARPGIMSILFRTGIAGNIFDLISRTEEIYFLAIATLLLWTASILLSAHYVVDIDGVRVKHWWRKHYIFWEDIERITFQTNFGFGYIVHIKKKGKKLPVRLSLAGVGNSHKLGKAIIEAATLANPKIRFLGMHEYGPPPYGIFAENNSSLVNQKERTT